MQEKRRLLIRKIAVVAAVVLPLIGSTVGFICMEIANGEERIVPWIQWVFILYLTPLYVTWIPRLYCRCKVYEYQGKEIVVYAGRYRRYLEIDGVKIDQNNKITFVTNTLKGVLEDGTYIETKINFWKRITLKINDEEYLLEKK